MPDHGLHEPDLRLPESRPGDALRAHGLLWLLAFLAINVLALNLAMGVHGAGFDDCEAMPTSGDRRVMAAIGLVAVIASASLALWRLRRWGLVAALAGVALSGMAWLILVSVNSNCLSPA